MKPERLSNLLSVIQLELEQGRSQVYSESLAQYYFSIPQSFHLKAGKFYFIQWKSSVLVTGSCTSCLISFAQWVTEFNYCLNKLPSHFYHHSCSYQNSGSRYRSEVHWHVPHVTSLLLTPLLLSSKNTLLPWWFGDLPLKVSLESYSLLKSDIETEHRKHHLSS